MNYLCDTSALLAHTLQQTGADVVQRLLDDETHHLAISALSLFEVAAVLKRHAASDKIPMLWDTYEQMYEIIPVDGALAQAAWKLREQADVRIPLADAIIAATAQAHQATLVHCDQHLDQIPETLVPQMRLARS